ncbi:40S ribosomal protein mrp10 [Purpureocillium lavendulum]|uniref:non-specific serine/threonine protein kinase n=1 Tax=Purpureocillium lavendulum TaxID=1247861 RepID=A0AB34FQR3_9HYPO|nr:40S ribosomal protein mrp10 [Purpureocillium lavendulum]
MHVPSPQESYLRCELASLVPSTTAVWALPNRRLSAQWKLARASLFNIMAPPTTDTTGMNPERASMLRDIAAGGTDRSLQTEVEKQPKTGPQRSGANSIGLGVPAGDTKVSRPRRSKSSAVVPLKRSSGALEEQDKDRATSPGPRPQLVRPPVFAPVPAASTDSFYLANLLRHRPFRLVLESPPAQSMAPVARTHFLQITDAGLVINDIVRRQSNLPILHLPALDAMDANIVAPDGGVDRVAHGALLEDVWHRLSTAAKYNLARQLRRLVKQMRKTPQNPRQGAARQLGSVLSGDYSLLLDRRQNSTYWAVRQKPTQQQFVAFLLSTLSASCAPAIAGRIASQFLETDSLVLCHGDLSPRNIIVKNNNIVGIVGWDCAGWYPKWWEYVKFFETSTSPQNQDWYDYVDEIFDTVYIEELLAYQSAMRWQVA